MKYFLALVLLLLPVPSVAQDTQFRQAPGESDHDWHCRQLLFMLSYNGNSPEGRQVFLDTYKADGCGIYAKQPQPTVGGLDMGRQSETETELNGEFWSKMSHDQKASFVGGFALGYWQGFLSGVVAGGGSLVKLFNSAADKLPPEDEPKLLNDEVQKVFVAWLNGEFSDDPASMLYHVPQVTNAAMANEVDRFYSDPKNVVICMDTATLFSLESLKGIAWKEQDLAKARTARTSSGGTCKLNK